MKSEAQTLPLEPVSPIPAATVMSLRDTPEGMEVLMVQRTQKADFASGALLFPGGKVDGVDYSIIELGRCVLNKDLSINLQAIRVAGIRELFEETGLLYARNFGSRDIIPKEHANIISVKYRNALLTNTVSFEKIVKQENLELATDLLIPFAHWITPPSSRKRFDTHFLIAKHPNGQTASHDGSETLDTIWIKPSVAIADAELGERRIVFPTRMNLKKISQSKTVSEAINLAINSKVITVMPEVYEVKGGRHLKIPIEAGYGISETTVDYSASDKALTEQTSKSKRKVT